MNNVICLSDITLDFNSEVTRNSIKMLTDRTNVRFVVNRTVYAPTDVVPIANNIMKLVSNESTVVSFVSNPEEIDEWKAFYDWKENNEIPFNSFAVVTSSVKFPSTRGHFSNNLVDIPDGILTEKHVKELCWIFSNFGMTHTSRGNVWFTSDTHFAHQRIIELAKRPFANVEEMNNKLIENWNNVVRKDDIVYHLGDFALGSKDNVPNIVSKLNGKIHLVLGNHDSRAFQFYYQSGFYRVYDKPITVENFFRLSHEPPPWIDKDSPYVYLYGHEHGNPLYQTWTPNSVCVCVERHNYTPINFEVIKNHFAQFNQ